jgi:hypothetical protein
MHTIFLPSLFLFSFFYPLLLPLTLLLIANPLKQLGLESPPSTTNAYFALCREKEYFDPGDWCVDSVFFQQSHYIRRTGFRRHRKWEMNGREGWTNMCFSKGFINGVQYSEFRFDCFRLLPTFVFQGRQPRPLLLSSTAAATAEPRVIVYFKRQCFRSLGVAFSKLRHHRLPRHF